jgi:photosystem II stability/assembly factor-like uncharacterized protein
MKTSFRFLVLVLIVASTASAQWRQVVTRSFPDFNAAYFVNATTGWVVGSGGAMYKTVNGGLNWTPMTSGVLTSLSCVHFLDANVGVVGTTNRTVLVTANGGTTWTTEIMTPILETTSTIRVVKFFNSTTGLMLAAKSDTARIIKTTDGGATWTSVWVYKFASGEDFLDMSINGTNAIIVGKPYTTIYYSTNSGSTWTKATTPSPIVDPVNGITYTRSDLWASAMPTPTVAYATGWGSSAAGLQPTVYFKSTDGGATWTYSLQQVTNRTYKNAYGLVFKDAQNGLCVGAGGMMSKTTDGGINWVPLNIACGSTLNGGAGIGDFAVAVGSDGVILRTLTFGTSGSQVTPILSASNLPSIQFTSAKVGYAAGFNGVFLKTTDGGKNWASNYVSANGSTQSIQDMMFINDQVGYVSCSYRLLAKTTDGGNSWSALIPDTTFVTSAIYGVWFSDVNNGWAVGQAKPGTTTFDIIYKTTDGGATWSTQTNIATKDLRDVSFKGANGVAVGNGLKIVYSTNSGTSWNPATIATLPSNIVSTTNLRRVAFVDATTLVAVGGKAILRSTNAGANWTLVDSANTDLYDVKFNSTGLLGYAVGNLYCLKTTNGGTSWTNIIDTSVTHTTSIYSCAIDLGNNIWIGAASSTIFTTAPVTSVERTSDAIPSSFSLDQNYPNPFNPSTTISYQLSAHSFVTLKVYDLLGREISTLVDSYQTAGTYVCKFDVKGLASGAYIYELKQGALSHRKSMLLLK